MHRVLTSRTVLILLAQRRSSQEKFVDEAQQMTQEDNRTQTIKPDDLAEKLGVGRGAVYEGLRNGTIPSIRLGKRFIIPKSAIEEWLKQQGRRAKGTL